MGSEADLELAIKARDQTKAAVASSSKNFEALGRAGDLAKKALLGLTVAGVGVLAGAAKLAQAAADEQKGMERLAQSVRNTGRAYNEQFASGLETSIAAMERSTAFSDGELRDSLATIVTSVGDVDEAMRRQAVAVDLARAKNIDLGQASALLAKFTDENEASLRKLVPTIKENATAAEAFAEVQRAVSGQAAAYAKTAAGQWDILKNQFDNLKEDVGTALLPVFTKAIGGAIKIVDELRNGPLPGVIAKVGELKDAVVTKLTPIWDGISEKVRLAFGLITDTFRAFSSGDLGLLVDTIQETFGVRLTEPVQAFIGTVFTELRKIPGFVLQVAGSLGEMFDVLSGRRPSAGGVLGELIGGEKAGAVMGVLASIRDAMREAFDFVAPIIQKVVDKVGDLKTKFEELPPVVKGFAAAFVAAELTGMNDWLLNIANTAATVASGVYDTTRAVVIMTGAIATSMPLWTTWIGLKWLSVKAFAALALAAAPWILLAAAIAAAGYLLITNWDKVQAAIGWLGDRIGEFFGPFGQLLELFQRDAPYALGLLVGAFLRIGPAIIEAIGGLVRTVIEKVIEFGAALLREGRKAFDSLVAGAKEIVPKLPKIAADAVAGFVSGISDAIPGIVKAAADFAGRFLRGLKDALGIKSPSEETHELGVNVVDGFIQGIRSRQAASLGAVEAWMGRLKETLARELAQAQTMVATLGRHFAPAAGAGMQRAIGTTQLLLQAHGGAGSVSAAQLAAGPRFIHTDPATGNPIPIFHTGGTMPWDGLARLERGERITAARGGGGGGGAASFIAKVYLNGHEIAEATGQPQYRNSALLQGLGS